MPYVVLVIAAIEDNITSGSRVIVNVKKVETHVEFLRWSDRYPGYGVVRDSAGKQKVRRILRVADDAPASAPPSGDLPTEFASFLRDSYHVNVNIDGEYHHLRADHYGLEFRAENETRKLQGVVGDSHVVGVNEFGIPTLYPASMINSAMAEVVTPKQGVDFDSHRKEVA